MNHEGTEWPKFTHEKLAEKTKNEVYQLVKELQKKYPNQFDFEATADELLFKFPDKSGEIVPIAKLENIELKKKDGEATRRPSLKEFIKETIENEFQKKQ